MCLLLFEFSTEGFDEIFSEILVPAKLSAEVAELPETEAPETEEAEADAGWRFSTFSWDEDKRFLNEMGLGYGDVCHSYRPPSIGLSFSKSKFLKTK